MTRELVSTRDARKRGFLKALAVTGNITVAAHAVDVDRSTTYRWRECDPDFDRECQDAIEEAADLIEAEAYRRAVHGIEEPVVYQGQTTLLYERDEHGQILFEECNVITYDKEGNPLVELRRVPVVKRDENGDVAVLTIRKYSDSLLIRLLEAHKPDKYQRNSRIDLNTKQQLHQMTDDEIREELATLTAAGHHPGVRDDYSDLV